MNSTKQVLMLDIAVFNEFHRRDPVKAQTYIIKTMPRYREYITSSVQIDLCYKIRSQTNDIEAHAHALFNSILNKL